MLAVPFFKELENTNINFWRLSIFIIVAILFLVVMISIAKRHYKPKSDLGLFLDNDKFIYSPNGSLTLEVDWKNIEGIVKKGTGVSNYIIPPHRQAASFVGNAEDHSKQFF